MLAILHLLGTLVANLFKSRRRLEIESLFLQHQLETKRIECCEFSSTVAAILPK